MPRAQAPVPSAGTLSDALPGGVEPPRLLLRQGLKLGAQLRHLVRMVLGDEREPGAAHLGKRRARDHAQHLPGRVLAAHRRLGRLLLLTPLMRLGFGSRTRRWRWRLLLVLLVDARPLVRTVGGSLLFVGWGRRLRGGT